MDVNFKTDKSPEKLKEIKELEDINSGLKSLKITDKIFLENSSYGNIQYSVKINDNDFLRVKSEMLYRLEEGNGKCFFEVGLDPLGEKIGLPEAELKSSIENLQKIAFNLDSTLEILKFYQGRLGLIAEVEIKIRNNLKLTKSQLDDTNFNHSACPNFNKNSLSQNKTLEIKIGLFGEETSGKSTLVGVLVNNTLDNGEGSARQNIFRFQHEIQCGKTSSLSHQIIGFDDKGNLITHNNSPHKNYEEIILNSSKIISVYDLGGSEKAFKTTLSTLSPNYLDYFFLVVSAQQGITENTKLFLMLANSMNLPIVTIITMSDLVNQSDIDELIKNYKFLIKNLKHKKVPLVVNSLEDIMLFSRNLNENINPAIIISNKTGFGYDYLVNFLSTLILPIFVGEDSKNKYDIYDKEICSDHDFQGLNFNLLNNQNSSNVNNMNRDYSNITDFTSNPCQFDIHENFMVEGRLIIGGIVSKGKIMVGNKYYLGPCKNGDFM
jgi:GTPase